MPDAMSTKALGSGTGSGKMMLVIIDSAEIVNPLVAVKKLPAGV